MTLSKLLHEALHRSQRQASEVYEALERDFHDVTFLLVVDSGYFLSHDSIKQTYPYIPHKSKMQATLCIKK